MGNTGLRHESKHVIPIPDYFIIKSRLKIIADYDPNSDEAQGYRIRSLCFDNVYDKVLREKLYGVNQREKFRIRFYNGDTSLIKLEKKSRINGLSRKEVTGITREECERLLSGSYQGLLASGDPLKQELYAKLRYQLLRPRTIVDYRREAYLYGPGNVRLNESVRKHVIKSKTVAPSGIEITYEIRLKEMASDFVNRIAKLNGVTNAVLVSYNGEYMS